MTNDNRIILKQINEELVKNGKIAEAIDAYSTWQKANPSLAHVVQPNINFLKSRLSKKASYTTKTSQEHLERLPNLVHSSTKLISLAGPTSSQKPSQYDFVRHPQVKIWINELSTELFQLRQNHLDSDQSLGTRTALHKKLYRILDISTSLHLELLQYASEADIDPCKYSENIYLALNPDVSEAVAAGYFEDGSQHFTRWGRDQNRQNTLEDFEKATLQPIRALTEYISLYLESLKEHSGKPQTEPLKAIHVELSKCLDCANKFQTIFPPEYLNKFSSNLYASLNADIQEVAIKENSFNLASHYSLYGKHESRLHSISDACAEIKSLVTDTQNELKAHFHERYSLKQTKNDLVRPLYINQADDRGSLHNINFTNFSLAIHAHVYYIELLQELIDYISITPFSFDLFITYPQGRVAECEIQDILANNMHIAKSTELIPVPNRGRDLAPLVTVLRDKLIRYKYVSHIHTKKSEHTSSLQNWRDQILQALFCNKDSIRKIICVLQDSCDLVIAPSQSYYLGDPSGWGDNKARSLAILNKAKYSVSSNLDVVAFPEGGMFWMNQRLFAKLSKLNMSIEDFEEEPIGQDGSSAHALERLIGALATEENKKICQILLFEPKKKNKYYEDHIDYGGKLSKISSNDRVTILAYFLPQFHESIENNTWHGDGFTEWSNVRSANPLFTGHYQQRFPHTDIGYYSVEGNHYFGQTEKLMRGSGIDGLIFYHYWFSGTTILDEPAKHLLEHKDIKINWCFCWANENWTRAWDGNEDQILMKQEYSPADALEFIKYLIPFFKDERYLKINNRPILIIYRASHNPIMKEYVEIWKQECEYAGIAQPYLICTLTRGATNPHDYNFDAGLERVLHDWTAGHVERLNEKLDFFEEFSGSVLDYRAVSNYYMQAKIPSNFPFLRSIVPSWDNSPRYNSNAYLLHGSHPEAFSSWMRALILDARQRLRKEERILVINAWNEWAESAYLEPDLRFGYAYLNSVARSKLGEPYYSLASKSSSDVNICKKRVGININLPHHLILQLEHSEKVKEKFWQCLRDATKFHKLCMPSDMSRYIPAALKDAFQVSNENSRKSANIINIFFRRIEYLMPGALDDLIFMAINHEGEVIAANSIQYDDYIVHVGHNFSIDISECYSRLGVLATSLQSISDHNKARICTSATAFPSSYIFLEQPELENVKINTIIRIHAGGNFALFMKSLFSLYIMEGGVKVQPIICSQDVKDSKNFCLMRSCIDALSWDKECKPIIIHFKSTSDEKDCRSRMLVEPLKGLTSQYFGYLDHDDYLYPFAYSYLLDRIKATGKAVSFGRVYAASTDLDQIRIVKKAKDFEYGYSYQDFVKLNHAPIHSFLIDSSSIDISALSFVPGMKYMEDYYLTLQIFKPNLCDWSSLVLSRYIGDYTYSVGASSSATLSISSEDTRATITASHEYQKCEACIQQMRKSL